MEVISKKLSARIRKELNLDNDKEEIIAYGVFALIQIIISIIFTILFGIIFGVVIESLIVMITVIFLRKYSGGVHAKSPKLCLIFGTIVTTLLATISRNLSLIKFNDIYLILITILTFAIAFYIIYKKAPVGSKNKIIIDENKRKNMRFGALKILLVYLVSVILSIGIQRILNINLSYILFSICFGVLWQIFTLTKSCAFFIKKIESIL